MRTVCLEESYDCIYTTQNCDFPFVAKLSSYFSEVLNVRKLLTIVSRVASYLPALFNATQEGLGTRLIQRKQYFGTQSSFF